jgi:D-alanyl-D-alanine carboxypeptidase
MYNWTPNNVSTVSDLLRLGTHFKLYYPELLNITRVKEYATVGHSWENKNKFLSYPNFLGGKNGFTNEAKQSSLSYFSVFFRSDDPELKAKQRNIIVVIQMFHM